MFKFNFEDDSTSEKDDSGTVVDNSCHEERLKSAEASEVYVNQEHFSHVGTNSKFNFLSYGIYQIQHIQASMKDVQDNSVLEAESQHSDLIPGKYEGGFKIWECTQDLANFMVEKNSDLFPSGVLVLDLGCGAGILGLLALLQGCTVHFQDYNESVLNTLTIPNVFLNLNEDKDGDTISKCRFFAGDWLSFTQLAHSENILYDVILTSETIYNTDNYCKLLEVFKKLLKKTGSVFLAAKSCYFGVGGSLQLFKKKLDEDCVFTSVCCWSSKEGVQREILQLKFNSNVP